MSRIFLPVRLNGIVNEFFADLAHLLRAFLHPAVEPVFQHTQKGPFLYRIRVVFQTCAWWVYRFQNEQFTKLQMRVQIDLKIFTILFDGLEKNSIPGLPIGSVTLSAHR